jgi:hypothetical protein
LTRASVLNSGKCGRRRKRERTRRKDCRLGPAMTAPKTAAAGHRSGRRHETPLEAPREYEKVTARPQYEAGANHIFLSIFFFFGFFFAAMIHFLLV